jgi:hypothetical protein
MPTSRSPAPTPTAARTHVPVAIPLSPSTRVLTRRQAARYLGVSERSVQNLDEQGLLVRVTLLAGRRRRRALYDVQDLDRLVESRKTPRRHKP